MAPVTRAAKLLGEMAAMEGEAPSPQRGSCAACGEVIGVYEPLVHVVGAIAHATSRAADPDLSHRHGLVYHAACNPFGDAERVTVV